MARNLPCLWQAMVRTALALASLLQAVSAQNAPAVAAVTVRSPENLAGIIPAYFASFSAPLPPKGQLAAWAPASDPVGCQSYSLPDTLPSGLPGVAVVRRGNCTFLRKAQLAERAGAKGCIVVSDTDYVQIMGAGNDSDAMVDIMTIAVSKSFGDKVLDSPEPVVMSFEVYKPSPMNVSELLIILLGTSLVAAGAYFSTSDLSTRGSFQQAVAAPQEEVHEVDDYLAIGFFFFGSIFLVVLYFFMRYLIYVIIFAFCLGGFNTLTQFGSTFLQWALPALRKEMSTPMGLLAQADLLAGPPALATVISWFILRKSAYGWFLQDVIGAGFLCWLQRTLRLPNLKIASLFLSIMFCFDIFWVFISPLLFHGHSVMVTVAKGGDTHETVPMLLRLPAIGDPFGNDRMLGFGDIALPGLLISFLHRHDLLSRRTVCGGEGYFGPALVGYFIGLCVTIIALTLMQKGQPALLYLVPGTLGTTVLRALRRGELSALWDGRPCGLGAKASGNIPELGSACCEGRDGL